MQAQAAVQLATDIVSGQAKAVSVRYDPDVPRPGAASSSAAGGVAQPAAEAEKGKGKRQAWQPQVEAVHPGGEAQPSALAAGKSRGKRQIESEHPEAPASTRPRPETYKGGYQPPQKGGWAPSIRPPGKGKQGKPWSPGRDIWWQGPGWEGWGRGKW